MIENVTYQGQLGRSCHLHLEDFLLPKPSKKFAKIHFSSWLFINSQLQNVQFLCRAKHSKFSHWRKSTNVLDGENYTWTDSSSRNNIWSSFSSTDLNIKLIWISKCVFLSLFFKYLIKSSPGHKIPQLEELYSGLGVHWSIILLKTNIKTNLSSSLRLKLEQTHIEVRSWSRPLAAGRRWTSSTYCTRPAPEHQTSQRWLSCWSCW